MRLAELIAAEQARWDEPLVERAIFGVAAPEDIAEIAERLVRSSLGARVERALFYKVSVGCVCGLVLSDGRQVVLKLQRGERSQAYLEACCALREHLAARGFPCPRTVLGVTRVAGAWATVESLDERGEPGDGAHAPTRAAIARALAELVRLAADFDDVGALSSSWYSSLAPGRAFPRPHSPLFDFERTQAGAEWIEALARAALAARDPLVGPRVIGHYDFRVEHLRFAQGQVVTSYDWDSLHRDHEPVLVGLTAFNFAADWQRSPPAATPTLDEVRAFVAEYELARGAPFSTDERRLAAGSCVFAMSYRARCAHALGPERGEPGDARPALRDYGQVLLEQGL